MKSPSSLGLCVLMAACLFAAPSDNVHANYLPDDTGQSVQDVQGSNAVHVLTYNEVPASILEAPVVQSKDSTFNPRTDFPRRPAVITAGFASFTQECCGGSGSWNYADDPRDMTLTYLGAVLLFSVLLAAYVHRADRRQQEKRRMATN